MRLSEKREKRIRWLVRTLNRARKQQARKIDILCNDFIGAQKNFIKKLDVIAYTADFYESILGMTDLQTLLNKTRSHISEMVSDSSVTFFFRNGSCFEKHIDPNPAEKTTDGPSFHEAITDEVAADICTLNKICNLEELLAIGLVWNPKHLNKLTAVTIPLGKMGSCIGFILLNRVDGDCLNCSEINYVYSISSGLSRAVKSCLMLQP